MWRHVVSVSSVKIVNRDMDSCPRRCTERAQRKLLTWQLQSPGTQNALRHSFATVADLNAIKQRQLIIDDNLRRQNARRHHYDYHTGVQVLVKEVDPAKLQSRSHGPYPIHEVHANGTITIHRTPHIRERLNLRRVFPYSVQQVGFGLG